MSKLHSVGRANKGLFGSLRLFALAGFAAAAGLVTAPAFAQDVRVRPRPQPWARRATPGGSPEWTRLAERFCSWLPTGGTATLPTVSDANAAACAGEGAVSYKLYSADGTELAGGGHH